MTRYEWTPASEPPDSARWVEARMRYRLDDEPYVCMVLYIGGRFHGDPVIEWRNVEPPNSSATLTGSGEGKT